MSPSNKRRREIKSVVRVRHRWPRWRKHFLTLADRTPPGPCKHSIISLVSAVSISLCWSVWLECSWGCMVIRGWFSGLRQQWETQEGLQLSWTRRDGYRSRPTATVTDGESNNDQLTEWPYWANTQRSVGLRLVVAKAGYSGTVRYACVDTLCNYS